MQIDIFDHYPMHFAAQRDNEPVPGDDCNYNRVAIIQQHATVRLWLTEAQANALRAVLDELYPSVPVADLDPAAAAAIDLYAEEHANEEANA